MGKKLVIIALLAIIFAAAIAEYFYVKGATLRLTAALEDVQNALVAENSDAAQAASKKFSEQWEDEKKRLEALYEHNEVDVLSATAERIEAFCGENDRVNALAEVSSGLFYIGHLREMISLSWENIL